MVLGNGLIHERAVTHARIRITDIVGRATFAARVNNNNIIIINLYFRLVVHTQHKLTSM